MAPNSSALSCRLLYLVGQLGPGGLERQLWYLLRAMDRPHYRPAVAVWNGSQSDVYTSHLRALDVPVYSLPAQVQAAARLRACSRLIRRLNPEVVHSYSFYTNFAAFWGTRGTRAIAVGSVRCEFDLARRDAGLWLGRLSARWPRGQVFNNASAARACEASRSLFVPKLVSLVRNRLDLDEFSPVYPLGNGTPRVLAVGSLIPIKRWDRLCRVAAALKRGRVDCVIEVVGDGCLRQQLEQQVRELDIADRLRFTGFGANVAGRLADAMFLVHTSDSEGCPNAVMEAMACGRAVVAMDVGDVSALVDHGETGFVIPRGDEASLLRRVATLIADPDLCRRMGEAGRRKAERQFGLERLVSGTLAAYRAMGWKDAC